MIDPPTGGKLLIEGKEVDLARHGVSREMRRKVQIVFQNPYGSLNPRQKIGDVLAEPLALNTGPPGRRPAGPGHGDAAQGRAQAPSTSTATRTCSPAASASASPSPARSWSTRSSSSSTSRCPPSTSRCRRRSSTCSQDLQDEFSLTYVFISHDLSVVRHVADDVMVMNIGEAVEYRSRDAIFAAPEHPYTRTLFAATPVIDEAASALREMQQSPELALVPVVVVDDDPTLRWRSMHGVPIAGPIDQLAEIVESYDVGQILLAAEVPSRTLARKVADVAELMQVPVRILRPSASWVHGMPRSATSETSTSRTSSGGSRSTSTWSRSVGCSRVGGCSSREVAAGSAPRSPARSRRSHPSQLVLLDHDETHLHDAMQDLAEAGVTVAEMALADIRDSSVLDAIFVRVRPEVVFHGAAHKHVPVLEDYACEAIRTNVFGTLNVIEACRRAGTPDLVCISTDKAATPTSVMGATKWLAEQLVLARAPEGSCSVRFGNVLGSRGSVIPTFQRQIAAGGPVTVTDRAMTRYFMNTDEAVRLVLHAAAVTNGRSVLALEMGEQINIFELAERMIRLCGRVPHADIEIAVTGLRPGENLVEALVGPAERREAGRRHARRPHRARPRVAPRSSTKPSTPSRPSPWSAITSKRRPCCTGSRPGRWRRQGLQQLAAEARPRRQPLVSSTERGLGADQVVRKVGVIDQDDDEVGGIDLRLVAGDPATAQAEIAEGRGRRGPARRRPVRRAAR